MINPTRDIIVLGAGPAGVSTALGLSRLGYTVTVIQSPRTYVACEGLSERVLSGLRDAGCHRAVASLATPTPRDVNWNGLTSTANWERLTLRQELDNSLLGDLEDAGINIIEGRASHLEKLDCEAVSVRVHQKNAGQVLVAGFVVDARGRSAPGGGGSRSRGPETVSLLQRWQGRKNAARSMAVSFADGWAWLARTGDGQCFTQISVAADDPKFPKKAALNDYFLTHLKEIEEAAAFYQDATPLGKLVARSSTNVLHPNPVQGRVIRVGDAAMASDPLSGNGIFNAVSTGLIAPSIINTILQSPERSILAAQFYNDRIEHVFQRFARTGRDFYALENRWSDWPFWRIRAEWPDNEPAHGNIESTILRIENRPVVVDRQIHQREIVITSDQPLGIWHLNGLELAPVIRELDNTSVLRGEDWSREIPSLVGISPEKMALLETWLIKYGVLGQKAN